jgi:hypothetical protein
LLVGVQVGGHGGLDAETAEKSAQKPVVDPTCRLSVACRKRVEGAVSQQYLVGDGAELLEAGGGQAQRALGAEASGAGRVRSAVREAVRIGERVGFCCSRAPGITLTGVSVTFPVTK